MGMLHFFPVKQCLASVTSASAGKPTHRSAKMRLDQKRVSPSRVYGVRTEGFGMFRVQE